MYDTMFLFINNEQFRIIVHSPEGNSVTYNNQL